MRAMNLRDLRIGLALFAVAATVGMLYPATWGGTPHFFQELFGPAVMYACGQGWTNPVEDDVPALAAFLHPAMHVDHPPAVDGCDCNALPDHLATEPWSSFQQRQRYLIYAAGFLWRLLGVAWRALAPLYGLLYGLSAVALYAIFRLGMGRMLSTLATLLLVVSPIQLNNLLRLRDYSKAPFILLGIALTSWMILHARTPRRLLLAAAGMGILAGLGVGFRLDVVIMLPAFAVSVACFAPPPAGAWRVRVAAVLLCAATYYAVSWPVTHALQTGMKYQDFLLGLNDLYDSRLGVGGAPYQIGHRYFDREPMAILQAYATRFPDEPALYEFDTEAYEAIGRRYSLQVLSHFPADLALRALAAVLRTVDELTFSTANPAPRGVTGAFTQAAFAAVAELASPVLRFARYAIVLALLCLAGRNLRLAWAALFLLLYFGGYGAIQFASRHYFHLQFLGLWAMGFLAWAAVCMARETWALGGPRAWWAAHAARLPRAAGRAAIFAAVSVAAIVLSLQGLRVWQAHQLKPWREAVMSAPTEPVPIARVQNADGVLLYALDGPQLPVSAPDAEPSFHVEYWVAEFDTTQGDVAPTIRYRGSVPDLALTWSTHLPATTAGSTRLVFPVYSARWLGAAAGWTQFEGMLLPEAESERLRGISRIPVSAAPPLLLTWTLPPDATSQPLRQRLVR